jgi:hypothetical protein
MADFLAQNRFSVASEVLAASTHVEAFFCQRFLRLASSTIFSPCSDAFRESTILHDYPYGVLIRF